MHRQLDKRLFLPTSGRKGIDTTAIRLTEYLFPVMELTLESDPNDDPKNHDFFQSLLTIRTA